MIVSLTPMSVYYHRWRTMYYIVLLSPLIAVPSHPIRGKIIRGYIARFQTWPTYKHAASLYFHPRGPSGRAQSATDFKIFRRRPDSALYIRLYYIIYYYTLYCGYIYIYIYVYGITHAADGRRSVVTHSVYRTRQKKVFATNRHVDDLRTGFRGES